MKTKLHAKPSGFTLIELLTVIAIIGILAAIIIPTVGRVRESALKSKSTSNLRQWGTALHLYTADNNNRMPLRAATNSSADRPSWAQVMSEPFQFAWYNVLPPYVSERPINQLNTSELQSRLYSDDTIHRDPRAEFTDTRKTGNPCFSYSLNSQINNSRSDPSVGLSNTVQQSLSRYPNPSNTVYMFESRSNPNDGTTNETNDNQSGRAYGHSRHVSFRYNGKVTMTFLDGSVRTFNSRDIYTGTTVNNNIVFFSGLE